MPMNDEQQLGQSLRSALHAELSDVQATPGLAAAIRTRHSRRTSAARTAVVTPLALAVATAGVITAAGRGQSANPGTGAVVAPSATSQLRERTVAYVGERTDAALAQADRYLMRSVSTVGTAKVHDEYVIDPVTGRSRFDSSTAAGQPLNSIMISGPPDQGPTVTVVSHTDRAWWTYTMPKVPSRPGGEPMLGAGENPMEIREAVRAGKMKIIGDEQLDGRAVIHLQVTNLPHGLDAQFDLWVDTQTYLPYRGATRKGTQTFIRDYAWLPRTPQNLAILDLTPPAGYRHSDKPINNNPSGQSGDVG